MDGETPCRTVPCRACCPHDDDVVEPGSAGDYFATDGPATWTSDEDATTVDPADTGYYRLDGRTIDESLATAEDVGRVPGILGGGGPCPVVAAS